MRGNRMGPDEAGPKTGRGRRSFGDNLYGQPVQSRREADYEQELLSRIERLESEIEKLSAEGVEKE